MELRIYHAHITSLNSDCRFHESYLSLPLERRQRIDRMIPSEGKRQLLGTGLLLQRMCRDADIPGADSEIGRNAFGKPFFLHYPDIHFNLSHSGNNVFGVMAPFEVGCDIQKTVPFDEKLARRISTEAEYESITLLSDEEKKAALTEMWCRKEAVMKALGLGFSFSPKRISTVNKGTATIPERNESFSLIESYSEPDYHTCTAFLSVYQPVVTEIQIQL